MASCVVDSGRNYLQMLLPSRPSTFLGFELILLVRKGSIFCFGFLVSKSA